MSNYTKVLAKIYTVSELALQIERWKIKREKVVFTNGCFDILHKGHVTYLAKASDFGQRLVVGVNSDASLKRLGKGDDRPVNPEEARSQVLASLAFVDAVVVFDEDTPLRLIELLQPDVLVKGADYDPNEEDPKSKKYIVGRETMIGLGGEVKTVDLVDGFSTTGIINKLKRPN